MFTTWRQLAAYRKRGRIRQADVARKLGKTGGWLSVQENQRGAAGKVDAATAARYVAIVQELASRSARSVGITVVLPDPAAPSAIGSSPDPDSPSDAAEALAEAA